jgi:nicotinamidase-related amidase
MGIQKIILIGMVANTCVESTARFGMELGYHTIPYHLLLLTMQLLPSVTKASVQQMKSMDRHLLTLF